MGDGNIAPWVAPLKKFGSVQFSLYLFQECLGGVYRGRQQSVRGQASEEVPFRSVQFISIPGVSRRGGSGTARCRDAVSGRVARGRAA